MKRYFGVLREHPENPEEGDCYVALGDNHLTVFIGGKWDGAMFRVIDDWSDTPPEMWARAAQLPPLIIKGPHSAETFRQQYEQQWPAMDMDGEYSLLQSHRSGGKSFAAALAARPGDMFANPDGTVTAIVSEQHFKDLAKPK